LGGREGVDRVGSDSGRDLDCQLIRNGSNEPRRRPRRSSWFFCGRRASF
jgi:hypothetical protein